MILLVDNPSFCCNSNEGGSMKNKAEYENSNDEKGNPAEGVYKTD
jgi:hypothetical protein